MHACFPFSCTMLFAMARIAGVLHTKNDFPRVARALETLRACQELIVIDHGSDDGTLRIAREYGAKILTFDRMARRPEIAGLDCDWLFCLTPFESVSESLEATLYEWHVRPVTHNSTAFSVFVREETRDGWIQHSAPELRLVPTNWPHWERNLPALPPNCSPLPPALEGKLQRFAFP
jgi:hypothetical protein